MNRKLTDIPYLSNGVRCRLVWLACVTCSINYKSTQRRGAIVPHWAQSCKEGHLVTPLGEGFPSSPSQATGITPVGLWPDHDACPPTSAGRMEDLVKHYWLEKVKKYQSWVNEDDFIQTLALNHGITIGRLGRRQGTHECYHIQLGTGKLPMSMQAIDGYKDDDRSVADVLPFWKGRWGNG